MDVDWSLIIAIWGAVLSTLLAILKFCDFWSARFHVDVTHVFRSDPKMGNDIHIRNLSGRPVILEYVELFYQEGRWPRRIERCFWSPEDSLLNLRIEPANNEVLSFSEADHFSYGKGRKILVRLYFVGRKVIVKRVGG